MERQAWKTPHLVSLDTGLEARGKIPLGFEFWIIGDHQDHPEEEGES